MNSQNSLSYEVSNVDFKKRIHHPFKLVLYNQLNSYDDIISLLPNTFSILIILLQSDNGNHWTSLVRRGKILTYWDSYGKIYDGEFYLIPKAAQIQLNEQNHYLTTLLNKAKQNGYTLQWNKIDYQAQANGINDCGKWVYMFIEASIHGLSLKQFQNSLKQTKNQTGKSYDDIVNEFWITHK